MVNTPIDLDYLHTNNETTVSNPVEPVVSGEKVGHKILFDTVDDTGLAKTTHDKITYDTLTEAFTVDLGEGCWCEVYGLNRFSKAVMLAGCLP